jgi:parallel beta-helix repeat protein
LGNTISDNDYGIYLQNSPKNRIYHNRIINNTNQAYDDRENNFWNDTYPSEPGEGAYDDYKGPDQDMVGSEGIVDNGSVAGGGKNPYIIDADSQDNYPLMQPYKPLDNYTILKQGWNLISIPLIQEEQNLTIVLGSIDSWYDAVQWYNPTDLSKPWKHNRIGKSFGNDLSEINESVGFWIHITNPGDTIFLYNGTQPTSNQSIILHLGWNMVGYPSLPNRNRTAALNNLTYGLEVDAIWTFNNANKNWEEIREGDYFEVGRGYWIHATQECMWEVPV